MKCDVGSINPFEGKEKLVCTGEAEILLEVELEEGSEIHNICWACFKFEEQNGGKTPTVISVPRDRERIFELAASQMK